MKDQLWDGLGEFKKFGSFSRPYPSKIRRFFAPDDDVHGAMMSILHSVQRSLEVAMFAWDDDEVNTVVLNLAANSSVTVKVALDSRQATGPHEQALLQAWPKDVVGADLAVGESRMHAISHLKLFVVDGLYTIGGSTNLSRSAIFSQNNELVIVRDPTYAAETRAKIDLVFSEMLQQANVLHAPSQPVSGTPSPAQGA